jgi:PAS domain S-box-containing protein
MSSPPVERSPIADASETTVRRLHVAHSQPLERRKAVQNESPLTTLKQMRAMLVLERISIPVLAVSHDGSIFFTNTAFADMVGRKPEEVLSLRFPQIFFDALDSEHLLSIIHALANMVVDLAHKDGSVVRALMSSSALMRADDRFVLVAFQDRTQQLWEAER